MRCLNCGEEMINNLVLTKGDQISYDVCEACGSLWLDAGELDKMAFQVEGSIEFSSTVQAQGDETSLKECPRCDGQQLRKVVFVGYSDIMLDHCTNCGGFWLDGGELDLINRELQAIMPVQGKGFSDFVNNVHLPYWHKRIRRRSGETDYHVDVPPLKHARLLRQAEARCPACLGTLNVYGAHGIEVEGCPRCKGIWCDREELRKLKDRALRDAWHDLRWMDDEVEAIESASAMPTQRACPKCDDARLLATGFGDSGVLIDWCPSCRGTWLDRGEFDRIVRYLRSRLDSMSAEEIKDGLYEELKEIWGGPEGAASELLDAKAAVWAFINIVILEHPRLHALLSGFSRAARGLGA